MSDAPPDVFAAVYGAQLLCRARPQLVKQALLRSLERTCPGVKPLADDEDALLGFVHPAYETELLDATVPAQTFFVVHENPPEAANFEAALTQAWGFPDARQAVQSAEAVVLVTDLMASGLAYRDRVDLFQRCQHEAALLGPERVVLDLNPGKPYAAGNRS